MSEHFDSPDSERGQILDKHKKSAPALRDYQRDCLKTILSRYKAGVRRQLVCLPTGTGKTVIFASFPKFFRMKRRMLVLAHREELLDQAREKIVRANPHLSVEKQASRSASPTCDVVVGSVQTLGRRSSSRIRRIDPEQFYLVVVDEAHHAIAPTLLRPFWVSGKLPFFQNPPGLCFTCPHLSRSFLQKLFFLFRFINTISITLQFTNPVSMRFHYSENISEFFFIMII